MCTRRTGLGARMERKGKSEQNEGLKGVQGFVTARGGGGAG